MNFLQKTLLAALPCVMLNFAPSSAMANDNMNALMDTLSYTQNSTANKADGLIANAKNFIGLPYRYGGTSPVSGFDCSGFMQYVFKESANIDLPRTSGSMAQMGSRVDREELRPGDMVFFSHGGGRISHVGMYIGEGHFIHAPSTGKSIEISNLDGYWSSRFVTARRVLDA